MARNAATKAVETAATTTAKSVGSRVGPYLVPPLGALVAFPAGEGLHLAFGASPWGTVGMTALTIGLTGMTWHHSSAAPTKRARMDRWHATLSSAVSLSWLTTATIEGLIAPVDKAGAFASLAVIGAWTVRRWTRNTGGGHSEEHSDSSLFSRVKLNGAKVAKIEEAPNRVEATVQVGDEHTADDLVEARPAIAARLGVAQTAVRALPDPDNHSRGKLIITPRDLLRTSPTWPGPLHVGGTMADSIGAGIYGDGEPLLIYLVGDPRKKRVTVHILITGMSGAGKGVLARNVIAGMAVRREATWWVIDVSKPGQNIGAAAAMADWFATTQKQARAMLRCLPDVIAARANYLGKKGLDAWMPGCGLNHLLVEIEEAADVIADLEDLKGPMATARSVGVTFLVSQQRASHDNMPTSVRANIGGTACFGLREEKEAQFALTSEVLDAGAAPWVWQATKPGSLYLAGVPWVDPERYAIPARTFYNPFGDEVQGARALGEWVKRNLHYRDAIDAVTAEAAGKAWLGRESFNGSGAGTLAEVRQRVLAVRAAAPAAERSALAAPAASAPAAIAVADAVPELPAPGSGALELEEADAQAVELIAGLPEDMRCDLERLIAESQAAGLVDAGGPVDDPSPLTDQDRIRAAQALARQPDPALGQDGEPVDPLAALSGHQEMTPQAARAYLLSALEAQERRSPGFEFRARDLTELIQRTGNGPSWGRKILSELTNEGVLERVETGLYRLPRPVPAMAGG
jgi:hypothetical protein